MTAKEKATELHGKGYNCAQSVLMSMGGVTGMDEKTAASVAASCAAHSRAPSWQWA